MNACLGMIASRIAPVLALAAVSLGCADRSRGASEATSHYHPTSVELYLERREPDACSGERMPAVAFAAGSAEIAPELQLAVDELARCLTTRPYDRSPLLLVAHGDDARLARARAGAVAARLIGGGVSPARISVAPHAELDGARRVEIVVGDAP